MQWPSSCTKNTNTLFQVNLLIGGLVQLGLGRIGYSASEMMTNDV